MRIIKIIFLSLLLLACGQDVDSRSIHGAGPLFTPAWQTMRQGAGGYSSGIYSYPDGTILIRTDTMGAYLYTPSGSCSGWGSTYAAPCWQQLVTASSVPNVTIPVTSGNLGVGEIVACASNTNVGYMIFNNLLYVTTNLKAGAAVVWVATTQATSLNANSSPPKSQGPYLACDPNNPDILYMGVNNKVVYTKNGRLGGSATFTTETDVGTTGSLPSAIVFDPASSTHIWIFAYSTGVYETTNGGQANGGSFSLTTSGPTTFEHMYADKFSQLWVPTGTTSLRKYVNGTGWATVTVPSAIVAIAADPASTLVGSNHLAGVGGAGGVMNSTNNGGSWTGPNFNGVKSANSPQAPWLATTNEGDPGSNNLFLTTGNVAFDSSSNFLLAAGVSIWSTPSPITVSATPWSANMVGMEQLVVNQVISPPGIGPISALWDRGVIPSFNPDAYPTVQYPTSFSVNAIQGAWGIDYAAGTTGFASACIVSNIASDGSPASTSDGGHTWTGWAASPSGLDDGCLVAVSTATNWVVLSKSSSGTLRYTTNGGTSWNTSTVPGTPVWATSVQNNRQTLAADRVTAGKFYAVDDSLNVYSSTDSGANWTKLTTSTPFDGTSFADILQTVPGQAGHLFYSSGNASGNPANTHLWKSTASGGVGTWNSLDVNLKQANAFGFGAIKPGQSYPAIYAQAWLSGVLGFYASFDSGTTWAALNVPASARVNANNSLDQITWVAGDADIYGRVYVGFRGSGPGYIDVQDACPWINFTNTNPNAALTGTVTLTAQHSGLVPVTGVNFYIDGVQIGATQTGQSSYSVALNASAQTPGAHTLKVQAAGNGCSFGGTGNFKSIPITTSANDNFRPLEGTA